MYSVYNRINCFFYSKGDTGNAVKFLEMYVSVSEKAGLQHSLAKAYSAIGIMYNTLVSNTNLIVLSTFKHVCMYHRCGDAHVHNIT